jgi:hypothetical protein
MRYVVYILPTLVDACSPNQAVCTQSVFKPQKYKQAWLIYVLLLALHSRSKLDMQTVSHAIVIAFLAATCVLFTLLTPTHNRAGL